MLPEPVPSSRTLLMHAETIPVTEVCPPSFKELNPPFYYIGKILNFIRVFSKNLLKVFNFNNLTILDNGRYKYRKPTRRVIWKI